MNKRTLKEVIGYIKRFYSENLNKFDIILGLLFVAVFTYINYGTNLISDIRSAHRWDNGSYLFFFLLYGLPFLTGFLIQSATHKDWSVWKNPKFYILTILAIGIFTFRSSFHLTYQVTADYFRQFEHYRWHYATVYTIARMALIFLLVGVYWFFFEKDKNNFYGFKLKGFKTRPYFMMLLIMLPLIILASTQSDFLSTYPRTGRFDGLDITNAEHHRYFIIYELVYGLDFFSIEFFFRGFLVMAFIAVAGPRVILPMALFYVVIHFEKPAGELISSFFGGSLLGIIAYYSRSIIGGIIVHVGIAWMMELGAFIGQYLKS